MTWLTLISHSMSVLCAHTLFSWATEFSPKLWAVSASCTFSSRCFLQHVSLWFWYFLVHVNKAYFCWSLRERYSIPRTRKKPKTIRHDAVMKPVRYLGASTCCQIMSGSQMFISGRKSLTTASTRARSSVSPEQSSFVQLGWCQHSCSFLEIWETDR